MHDKGIFMLSLRERKRSLSSADIFCAPSPFWRWAAWISINSRPPENDRPTTWLQSSAGWCEPFPAATGRPRSRKPSNPDSRVGPSFLSVGGCGWGFLFWGLGQENEIRGASDGFCCQSAAKKNRFYAFLCVQRVRMRENGKSPNSLYS